MIQPHVGYSGNPIAPAVAAETTHANGFVTAGLEKCWSRFDERELHDVFIVISQGAGRRTHRADVLRRRPRRRPPNTPRQLRRRAPRGGSPIKPSRLVTFAAVTSHRTVRASGQARVLTGIWPGSPSRRWELS